MEFESSNNANTKALVEACLNRVVDTSYLHTDVSHSETIISKLIDSDKLLTKIHLKSRKRSLTDKKVAPGSDSVVCSVLNARYCLCLINVNLGKYYELQSRTLDQAIACYQRALIWHPQSVH